MKSKRVFKAILGLGLGLSMTALAACGGQGQGTQAPTDPAETGGSGQETLRVGAVLASTYTEFWSAVAKGVEDAGKELGVEVTVVAPAAEADVAGQTSMLEDMITKDIDALVLAPVDSTALTTPLKGAVDKGIPVVVFDSDTGSNRDVFVGISNEEAAASVAPVLESTLGSGAKYVMIGGLEGHQANTGRTAGFKQAIEASGGELLELQNGDWTADKAMSIMENFLSKFPEIDGVLCASDNTALGALRAVQTSGRDIKVVGFDANESAVQEVIKGAMLATISQDAYQIGFTSLESAVKLAKGEKLDEFITVPTKLVTQENAQEFYDSVWGKK